MGDRLLIQARSKTQGKISPVLYFHWSGSSAPEGMARLSARMKTRAGDVDYTIARAAQEMMNGDDGCFSFRLWNAPAILEKVDSHGDAGIIIIDVDGPALKFTCFGGYLKASDDGLTVTAE